jgi:hypothetical protein
MELHPESFENKQYSSPITLTDMSNGFICSGAVAESMIPNTVVTESLNFDFDRIGCATLRKGTTLLGNKISATDLLGLYEFRDSGSGTNNALIAVNGSKVYRLNGTTWTSLRDVSSGCKAEFTTYLDYTFMVNGTDPTMTWDGNPLNSFGSTNAASAPVGIDIEVFRNRVWIINSEDRVYYSSLPDETLHSITWSTDTWWIDISPQDGDNVVKLQRTKTALLVFKRNHLYRIYSTQETEPDPKINVGTYSGRSVVEASDGIYFHHPSGIYRYNEGVVDRLSQPVSDFIENVTVANYSKVTGWEDGDHVYFAIGDVTVNGVAYTNVVLRYTISTKVWTVRSYPTQFIVSSKYNDGTTLFNLIGDESGNVQKINVGITDNETPIFYSLIQGPKTLDGSFATRKHISQMSVLHEKAQGTLIECKVDDDSNNKFRKIYQINEGISKPFTTNIRGNKIWFRASGTSVGEPFALSGYEILEVTSELII